MPKNIIQKIIDNRHDIMVISIDGTLYGIYCISLDDVVSHDQLEDDDVIIKAYLSEDDYYFTVGYIKNAKSVKLYKFIEDEDENVKLSKFVEE